MKIGFIGILTGIGGGEVSLIEMACNLIDRGHDVWFLFDPGNHATSVKFNKYGGEVASRCTFLPENSYHERCFDEDWAIENLEDTDFVFAYRRHLYSEKLTNAINSVPKSSVYCPGKNIHHVTGFAKGCDGYGRYLSNITNFIFNSSWTRDTHLQRGEYPQEYKDKFTHLHPPMYLKYYEERSRTIDKSHHRKLLNLSDDDFAIGVFGRIIPSKQPEKIIEIMNNIKRSVKDYHRYKLYFIGDGKSEKSVKQLCDVQGLENINFCGMLSDPFCVLQSMDVILHLCDHESMSRSLRESMVFSKPIIAKRSAGNKELCTGKLSEILFDDIEEAGRILVELSNEPDRLPEYGQGSFERIKELESGAVDELEKIVI